MQCPEHPSADQENRAAEKGSSNGGKSLENGSFQATFVVNLGSTLSFWLQLEPLSDFSKSVTTSIISESKKSIYASIGFGQQAVNNST